MALSVHTLYTSPQNYLGDLKLDGLTVGHVEQQGSGWYEASLGDDDGCVVAKAPTLSMLHKVLNDPETFAGIADFVRGALAAA